MKLSILVPVYNEENTVETLINKLHEIEGTGAIDDVEIITVDDCSSDGTAAILEKLEHKGRLRLIRHDVNQGKGAAIRTAIGAATGDYTVFQDADLEYDPADIVKMADIMLEKKLDILYGSRFLGRGSSPLGTFHYLVNKGLTLLSNMFTGMNLTDMETCYKMFRAEVIKRIEIRENRFGLEPEITARAARLVFRDGLRMEEIPIQYAPRRRHEGKKIGISDGFRAVYVIVKYGLMR